MTTSTPALSTRLDSIIIATDQPALMAEWYEAVLGASRETDQLVRHRDLQIILFPHDEVSGPSPQPERLMISFHVDDPEAFAAHLDTVGVNWKRPFEPESFGVMATVADPDGNYVQFLSLHDATAAD